MIIKCKNIFELITSIGQYQWLLKIEKQYSVFPHCGQLQGMPAWNRSKDDCDIHRFSTEFVWPHARKSYPIAHNGKQNLLVCRTLLNLLIFLLGVHRKMSAPVDEIFFNFLGFWGKFWQNMGLVPTLRRILDYHVPQNGTYVRTKSRSSPTFGPHQSTI